MKITLNELKLEEEYSKTVDKQNDLQDGFLKLKYEVYFTQANFFIGQMALMVKGLTEDNRFAQKFSLGLGIAGMVLLLSHGVINGVFKYLNKHYKKKLENIIDELYNA